jgi:hypothetical protein
MAQGVFGRVVEDAQSMGDPARVGGAGPGDQAAEERSGYPELRRTTQ